MQVGLGENTVINIGWLQFEESLFRFTLNRENENDTNRVTDCNFLFSLRYMFYTLFQSDNMYKMRSTT